MYKKYCQNGSDAYIYNKKKELVKIMPMTHNLEKIVVQENKLQKMEKRLQHLPKKIKKQNEKIKSKKKKVIKLIVLYIIGLFCLFVSNFSIDGLLTVVFSTSGAYKIVSDIISYIKTKNDLVGLECQMYFLKNEIPVEQEKLRVLYRRAKEIETKKETKSKKVPNRTMLIALKFQLEDWKYYGSHYKKYSKIDKNGNLEIINEDELQEEINVDTYKRYLNLRKLKKEIGE